MTAVESTQESGSEVAEYEPCPYCQGTGLRIKPPPPRKRGGRHPGPGSRHGYESTYAAGCRCDLCRAAHREGVRRRRQKAAT